MTLLGKCQEMRSRAPESLRKSLHLSFQMSSLGVRKSLPIDGYSIYLGCDCLLGQLLSLKFCNSFNSPLVFSSPLLRRNELLYQWHGRIAGPKDSRSRAEGCTLSYCCLVFGFVFCFVFDIIIICFAFLQDMFDFTWFTWECHGLSDRRRAMTFPRARTAAC